MKTNKQIEGELGPDNAEARDLMMVLHKVVDTSQHSKCDLEEEEEFTNTGVGRDSVSKYSYAEIEVDGKEYFVQVRDKENYYKVIKSVARNHILSDLYKANQTGSIH